MMEWWQSLTTLSRVLFTGAVFFSTVFAWQLISSISGLGGDDGGHAGAEGDAGDGHLHLGGEGDAGDGHLHLGGEGDAGDGHLHTGAAGHAGHNGGLAIFRLLSLRSLLAFAMLFTWAGFLYLQRGLSVAFALLWSLCWGLLGLLVVALFFAFLPRLTEDGTASLETAVGKSARVYLDIPAHGAGEVRVLVGGAVRFVRARSKDGRPLWAGTHVYVVRRLDSTTLEVVEAEV